MKINFKTYKLFQVLLFVLLLFSYLKFLLEGSCSFISLWLTLAIVLLLSAKKYPFIFSASILLLSIEVLLYFFSPYKSYNERNGKWEFVAHYFKHPAPITVPFETMNDNNLEFNFSHRFNQWGFRDSKKSRKKFQALILGDSFIQGVGTDEDNTIDKNLEKLSNCKDCVLNMGLGGSDVINNFSILQNEVDKGLSSKYLILNINSTDIQDVIFNKSNHKILDFKGRSYFFQYVYGISFLFRHIAHDLLNYNWKLLKNSEEELLQKKSKQLILKSIIEYNSFCSKNKMRLVVVFQPLLDECENQIFPLKTIIDSLDANNPEINTINLSNVFDGNCSTYFWDIDRHFNASGYQLYSSKLYKELNLLNVHLSK